VLINSVEEALSFRHIAIHKSEFAVSSDGNRLFGLLELDQIFYGGTIHSVPGDGSSYDCRFALGIRNSHDKTMRLAMTVGYRVFVCDNMAFHGDFTPVLAKHSKHFDLNAALAIGVDQMQRTFRPMAEGVERWRRSQLSDAQAKLIIYSAFTEAELDAPRHLDRKVHELYFNPEHEDFRSRTMWSLSNAFTSAFKELDPIPQFKVTAKLGAFLGALK
jgi:hypothetical protein